MGTGWIYFGLFAFCLGLCALIICLVLKDEYEQIDINRRQIEQNEMPGPDWGDYDPTDKLEPKE